MKPLFASVFAMLTVAVYADQYVYPQVRYSSVPMSETVTIYYDYGMPIPYSVSNGIVTNITDTVYVEEPMPYTVAKPADRGIVVPPPLGPLFPAQEYPPKQEGLSKEAATATFRGQINTVDSLGEYLNEPLPPAIGSVEDGSIDPKLTDNGQESESDNPAGLPLSAGALPPGTQASRNSHPTDSTGTKLADPLGYGVLLTALAITTIGLIYMIFVAIDYHQRWMQSQTTQNDRYLGGVPFDMDMEDAYSGGSASLSEGFGLTRRSI